MRLMAIALMAMVASAAGARTKGPPVPPTVIGSPIDCVQLHSIRQTNVIDDSNIDFVMNGNKFYRNTLPNSCPGLGFEQAFSYQTSMSQLCSVDIITVVRNGGGGPRIGASCGLGKFTPIAPPAKK